MRLAEEFRERTKRYASAIVQLYVQLPRSRREVEVLIRGANIAKLHSETNELIAIFVTMVNNTRRNN